MFFLKIQSFSLMGVASPFLFVRIDLRHCKRKYTLYVCYQKSTFYTFMERIISRIRAASSKSRRAAASFICFSSAASLELGAVGCEP